MNSFGSRLREERERLAVSVSALAESACVSEAGQIAFESGAMPLDARYLSDVSALGVDVRYVITGVRSQANALDRSTPQGNCRDLLLTHYSTAANDGKRVIEAVAQLAAARVTCEPSQEPSHRLEPQSSPCS